MIGPALSYCLLVSRDRRGMKSHMAAAAAKPTTPLTVMPAAAGADAVAVAEAHDHRGEGAGGHRNLRRREDGAMLVAGSARIPCHCAAGLIASCLPAGYAPGVGG
jgi:hypothetical protein